MGKLAGLQHGSEAAQRGAGIGAVPGEGSAQLVQVRRRGLGRKLDHSERRFINLCAHTRKSAVDLLIYEMNLVGAGIKSTGLAKDLESAKSRKHEQRAEGVSDKWPDSKPHDSISVCAGVFPVPRSHVDGMG